MTRNTEATKRLDHAGNGVLLLLRVLEPLLRAIRDFNDCVSSTRAHRLHQVINVVVWTVRLATLTGIVYVASMIYAEPSVTALAPLGKSVGGTEFARVAVFYILAASLLGPILAILGWLAIKFLFNLMEDSLSHVLPKIFRSLAPSVPLILLLLAVWTWQGQINDWVWTSYLTAERTVDSALSFTVKE